MWYKSLDGIKSDILCPNLPDIASLYNGGATRVAYSLPPDMIRNYYLTQSLRPNDAPLDAPPVEYAVKNLNKSMEKFSPESQRSLRDIADKDHYSESAKELIEDWNMAGNQIPQNIAFQFAANDLFGLGASTEHFNPNTMQYKMAVEIYKRHSKALKDFLLAQYENTQKDFKEKGIKTIPLYRGMHIGPEDIYLLNEYLRKNHEKLAHEEIQYHDNMPIHLQPLSSHSQNPRIAGNFAPGNRLSDKEQRHLGLIHRIDTPVDQILSHSYSGFGVPDESEVVLIGGNNSHKGKVITIPYGNIPAGSLYGRYIQPVTKAISPWLQETDENIGMLPGLK